MNWLKKILGLTRRDEQISRLKEHLNSLLDASAAVRPGTPAPLVWTPDDCLALRKFFGEATGRKLIELCGGHALHEAMREAHGDRTTPMAAGMDALLRFQFNLASDQEYKRVSRPAGDQAGFTGDGEQEDAALPALHPSDIEMMRHAD